MINFAGFGQRMETDMYKKQMILQRIVCMAVLIASALVFVYSLGLMTDLYDNKLNYYAEDYNNPMVAGSEIYYDMQGFNQALTVVGIVLILLAAAQFLFQNHVRRKYYIANYVTVGLNTVVAVAASAWGLIKVFTYKDQYLTELDFEGLKAMSEIFKFSYTESTFWSDISIFVFGVLMVVTVANVINLLWKMSLMKAEQKLIEAGKEGKAA